MIPSKRFKIKSIIKTTYCYLKNKRFFRVYIFLNIFHTVDNTKYKVGLFLEFFKYPIQKHALMQQPVLYIY